MKALQAINFGSPKVLVVGQLDKPTPSDSQILIKVAYSGINMADTYIRNGTFPGLPNPPFTLGMEGSGTIEAMGTKVRGFTVGQLVAFSATQTYAEYVLVDIESSENWEVAVPVTTSPLIAGSISMSAKTAFLLIQRLEASTNSKTVLVHAAAGSVGGVLVQLLKELNYEVIALVGSEHKKKHVLSLGADRALNYNTENLLNIFGTDYPNGIDIIFNATGGDSISRDIELLANNGHLIWYGFSESNQAQNLESSMIKAFMKSIKVELFNGGVVSKNENIAAIVAINKLIINKQLQIPIHNIYTLEEGMKAHCDLESGNTIGKLMIKI